jgi:uncharacterized membrane protein
MKHQKRNSLMWAGLFLGLGLGGLFDGIVLHQILQWHHMVSEQYPVTTLKNFELNTLLDGLFHGATYLFTVIGLWLLWRAIRTQTPLSGRVLIGAALIGWGLFNVVEGIIDHHLLQIHHVRLGQNELLWDVGFLVWGVLMLVGGWYLARWESALPKKATIGVGAYPAELFDDQYSDQA